MPIELASTDHSSTERQPLQDIDANASKKPKPTPKPKPTKPESATLIELRTITREIAQACMDRLRDGYTDAKSGSGYGGWVVTKHGCWVAQKGVNRESNGYIQIAPISTATRAGTTNGVVKAKPLPQGAHRLAVIASKRYKTPSCSLNSTNLYLASSNDDVQRMLDGDHASHRCHNPRCLNPEHLIVESKERNEARKGCAGRVQVYTTIGGLKYVLEAKACSCEGPPCIITKEEHRSATLLI
jgi:hypothetical protein